MTAPAALSAALADRYRIERELGAGGMATVYLAHDLKHEREVAIKVLHPDLAAALGGERFLSEIKTTAKLNHPHILPLLDSGSADGFLFYVMPYVTGETLRTRLERETQLPVADALRIAHEVADALEAAHALGIVHRDIKPENILLQGTHALVADFGIALAVQSAGGARMTQTGLSLGTPQYMAPEQAMGDRAVDHRADIYALGAVTYEMLTGEPPHTGPSAQAIVAKLLTEAVRPVSVLRPTVAAHVDAALHVALEKLPADRFATVHEFSEALRGGTGARTLGPFATPGVGSGAAHAPRRSTLLAGAALLALVSGAAGWLLRPASPSPATAQQVVLWKTDLIVDGAYSQPMQADLAPDGSALFYTDSSAAGWMLYRKARDEPIGAPMLGSEGAVLALVSPDSRTVAFMTKDGKLRKLPAEGGTPTTIFDVGTGAVGAWLDDGTIIVALDVNKLAHLSANGTVKRRITLESELTGGILSVNALPGARGFLVDRCNGLCTNGAVVLSYDLRTGQEREVMRGASDPHYSPSGHLLFLTEDAGISAVQFDVETMQVSGDRVRVIEGPVRSWSRITKSGAFMYQMNDVAAGARSLVWVDRAGRATPVDPTWQALFAYPALSPDGRSIAVTLRGAADDEVWVRRAEGDRQRLEVPGSNSRPTWLPDGRSVAVLAAEADDNAVRLFRAPLDGGTAVELLRAPFGVFESEFTPDNDWLVYRTSPPDGWRVRGRRLRGDTASFPIMGDSLLTGQIALSPDGKWLAVSRTRTAGASEIYVVPFPQGAATPRQVSRDGGSEPRWSRSGKELFFVSGARLMSLPVRLGSTFEAGEPRTLLSLDGYLRAQNRQQYDVAPGDDRFLMIRLAPRPPVPTIMLLDHWLPELTAKMRQ